MYYIVHLAFRNSTRTYSIKVSEEYTDEEEAIERLKELAWNHSLKKRPHTNGRVLHSPNSEYVIILLRKNETINLPYIE